MTDEERTLLVQVAKAVTALSHAVANGASPYEFHQQAEKIEEALRPLVEEVVSRSPVLRHLIRATPTVASSSAGGGR